MHTSAGNSGLPAAPSGSGASSNGTAAICDAVSVIPYEVTTGAPKSMYRCLNAGETGPPPNKIARSCVGNGLPALASMIFSSMVLTSDKG